MRIQPAAAFGADAAPLAEQQGAAEQVGPDLHPVEAPLVMLGADADQRGGFREQRQLNRDGRRELGFRAFGHNVTVNVSHFDRVWRENRRGHLFRRPGCYTMTNSVTPSPEMRGGGSPCGHGMPRRPPRHRHTHPASDAGARRSQTSRTFSPPASRHRHSRHDCSSCSRRSAIRSKACGDQREQLCDTRPLRLARHATIVGGHNTQIFNAVAVERATFVHAEPGQIERDVTMPSQLMARYGRKSGLVTQPWKPVMKRTVPARPRSHVVARRRSKTGSTSAPSLIAAIRLGEVFRRLERVRHHGAFVGSSSGLSGRLVSACR